MWEFNEEGLMARRFASINDATIHEDERRVFVAAEPAGGA
jgi:nuclear transport factor 2 (NTF2) superfamily protein